MMQSFDFIDIVLCIGLSQGLFLAIALHYILNRNKSANTVLALLLLIAVIMLFGRIAAYRIVGEWMLRFGILVDTTIFLFGPLMYMYVRRLSFYENPAFRLSWTHYIPAVLHLSYYFWTLGFPVEVFNALYLSGKLNMMFFSVEASGIFSIAFYWGRAFLLMKRYGVEAPQQLSYHQGIVWFLRFFMGALLLILVLWLFSFLSTYFLGRTYPYINYNTMWISIPLFMYVIGYFSLRQPEIFRMPIRSKLKSKKKRLKPEEIDRLQKQLHHFITKERVFLQPNLSLKTLSALLNASENDVSWLLNEVYKKSFYDYINSYRIQEFIIQVNAKKHLTNTILSMAMDAGFNSKSTFNNAFKTETKQTPSQFIKSLNITTT